jgi:3-deoxy-D-manno-octulosonic-acid transferase
MSDAERFSYKPSLLEEACRWLYSLLLVVLIPLVYFQLAAKSKKEKSAHKSRFLERIGFVPRSNEKFGYLFHCVSVGEVVAASCLIKRIMAINPSTAITITTTTATGSARVKAIFGDSVQHFYLPFDLPFSMNRLLRRVQPKAVFITEVELWPNLIHACWKKHIPSIVINARMTVRSAKRYNKISKLFMPMLSKISHVCAQGQRDYDNYKLLGINEDKLTLTNNIKFDQAASVQDTGQNTQPGFLGLSSTARPIFVAGSTHEGEETVVIETLIALLNDDSLSFTASTSPLVIIVPRHPERFAHVEKILEGTPLRFIKSSDANSVADDTNIVLLNEMGKLNSAYSVATYAFVGGSIANKGGHNALEPAAFSLPIMMGPNRYNNPVICEHLSECGALSIVTNAADMTACLRHWIQNPSVAVKAGSAGKEVLQQNSGAIDVTLKCISKYVTN